MRSGAFLASRYARIRKVGATIEPLAYRVKVGPTDIKKIVATQSTRPCTATGPQWIRRCLVAIVRTGARPAIVESARQLSLEIVKKNASTQLLSRPGSLQQRTDQMQNQVAVARLKKLATRGCNRSRSADLSSPFSHTTHVVVTDATNVDAPTTIQRTTMGLAMA